MFFEDFDFDNRKYYSIKKLTPLISELLMQDYNFKPINISPILIPVKMESLILNIIKIFAGYRIDGKNIVLVKSLDNNTKAYCVYIDDLETNIFSNSLSEYDKGFFLKMWNNLNFSMYFSNMRISDRSMFVKDFIASIVSAMCAVYIDDVVRYNVYTKREYGVTISNEQKMDIGSKCIENKYLVIFKSDKNLDNGNFMFTRFINDIKSPNDMLKAKLRVDRFSELRECFNDIIKYNINDIKFIDLKIDIGNSLIIQNIVDKYNDQVEIVLNEVKSYEEYINDDNFRNVYIDCKDVGTMFAVIFASLYEKDISKDSIPVVAIDLNEEYKDQDYSVKSKDFITKNICNFYRYTENNFPCINFNNKNGVSKIDMNMIENIWRNSGIFTLFDDIIYMLRMFGHPIEHTLYQKLSFSIRISENIILKSKAVKNYNLSYIPNYITFEYGYSMNQIVIKAERIYT